MTVWTSDIKGAGTDSNVFIQMYGEDGKTEEYKLRNRTDNFERNEIDKFKVSFLALVLYRVIGFMIEVISCNCTTVAK